MMTTPHSYGMNEMIDAQSFLSEPSSIAPEPSLVVSDPSTVERDNTASRRISLSFLKNAKYQVDFSAFAAPIQRETTELPADFIPSSKDIICGRGKKAFNHVGNKRFRFIISMNLQPYMAAKTRLDKTHLVNSIVDNIRESSPTASGFVKQDLATNRWVNLGDDIAREKVGHALRDAVAAHQESTKKSEMKPSKAITEKRDQDLLERQRWFYRNMMGDSTAITTQQEPDRQKVGATSA